MDIESFQKFDAVIKKFIAEETGKNVSIFTHRYLDPDAIGSQAGIAWLLKKQYNLDSVCFYECELSHPQNTAVVQLLDMHLVPSSEYLPEEFSLNILVDTIPSNAGTWGNKIAFDIVIDHHKEIPSNGFNGLLINNHTGSCCGQVYDLIKEAHLEFTDDVDEDSNTATALLVGIMTDCDNLLSDDTSEFERDAYWPLFKAKNPDALRRIMKFKLPLSWIEIRGNACLNYEITDGVAVVGLGMLDGKQRDILAYLADEISRGESVETCVAFAVFDGNRIEGVVRSSNASVNVSALSKTLAGKCNGAAGGGKQAKGAYRIPLSGVECDAETSDEVRDSLWQLILRKEKEKIFRISRK